MGAAPGVVRIYIDDEFDTFIGKAKLSAHEVGLADLIDITRLTDNMPKHRALVGIQPQEMGWGEQPTPVVAAALPIAAKAVLDLYHSWHPASDQIESTEKAVMAS